MSALMAIIDVIPRWLLLAVVAVLAALTVKLEIDVASARKETLSAKERATDLEIRMEKAATDAAEESRALQEQVTEAQNEARKRETNLRAAAAAASSQLDGLRGELGATRDQLANASKDAAVERAVAVGAVLADCSRRYSGLAEKAGRHVNDIRTLIDAWPKGKVESP